jgi:hypothetical protein
MELGSIFLSSAAPRLALELTQSNEFQGFSPQGEADHAPPASAEVKNVPPLPHTSS